MLSTCIGILKFTVFRARQTKGNMLGVSGLTLNLMSWTCKGYGSTSEIETFDSYVKKKVLNDEKRQKTSNMFLKGYPLEAKTAPKN